MNLLNPIEHKPIIGKKYLIHCNNTRNWYGDMVYQEYYCEEDEDNHKIFIQDQPTDDGSYGAVCHIENCNLFIEQPWTSN